MESVSRDFTIDVRKVHVLQEFAKRGTIAATAGALHLTPSAVSQQIAALSREAGVPLLVRHGRGVRLSHQANLLLEHAAVLNAQLERVRADLKSYSSGDVGQVVIGAFATAIIHLVAPAMAELGRRRPRLRLAVHEVEVPEGFTRLDSGDLDLLVTVDYRGGPPRHDPRYHRTELADDVFMAALPAGHPLADRNRINLADLAGERWVLGAVGGTCHEVVLAACAAAGFNPDVRHQTNDWNAALTLVAIGSGVALVPRLALPVPEDERVVLRPTFGPQYPTRHIYAAVRAGSERHPALAPALEVLLRTAQAYV